MTVRITRGKFSLRGVIAELLARGIPKARLKIRFTGDGVQTSFPIPYGWQVADVHSAGLLRCEGAGDDYSLTFDGQQWAVVFAIAPPAVFVVIHAEAV